MNISGKFKPFLNKKTLIIGGIILLLIVTMLISGFFLNSSTPGNLDTSDLTDDSITQKTDKTILISLHKNEGALYQAKSNGKNGVEEFLKSNPEFLPADFSQNARLIRETFDREDPYLQQNNSNLTGEHYVYQQTINGIPVFAGLVTIHLRANHDIYDVTGKLITNPNLTPEKLTKEQAEQIALKRAQEQVPDIQNLEVMSADKSIINKKLLGLSDDETNYVTYDVVIGQNSVPQMFSKHYFVNLDNGSIVYEGSNIEQALDRKIFDCENKPDCPGKLIRGEGMPAANVADGNNAYDFFEEIYNYFNNTFQRDSFDNDGATLNGYVNFPGANSIPCPNAFWDGTQMVFCPGLVVRDITAHELTHAIVQHTANLASSTQSLAINESIADIFANAIDHNWTMGEGSAIGLIRDMTNPPSVRNAIGAQPDRIFSKEYYCGDLDFGGGHQNNGILNKTFYLMSEGGTFNGCTLEAIGNERAHAIMYRVLNASYINGAANYYDMYSATLKACADLYEADSDTCRNVKRVLQATEMDQQTPGQQRSPICTQAQGKTPACATDEEEEEEQGDVTPGMSPNPTIFDNDTPTPSPTIPSQNNGDVSITTDRQSYQIGDPITICYKVPSLGFIKLIDILPDGTSQVLMTGLDELGTGDCIEGTISEPTGRECVKIEFNLKETAEACFQVNGSSGSPIPQTKVTLPPSGQESYKGGGSYYGEGYGWNGGWDLGQNIFQEGKYYFNTQGPGINIQVPTIVTPVPVQPKVSPKFECFEVKEKSSTGLQISKLECRPI